LRPPRAGIARRHLKVPVGVRHLPWCPHGAGVARCLPWPSPYWGRSRLPALVVAPIATPAASDPTPRHRSRRHA
jgi:hypothetical protein